MGVDYGYEALKRLISEYGELQNLNEADTRFRLIDTLFFDCLSWPRDSVNMEERIDGKYADYTFVLDTRVAILEAKREGHYFELPNTTNAGTLKLQTLLTSSGVKSALRQAMAYCQNRGVPLCIISNGRQLIAFVATRADGIAPLDGRAIVYPSLNDINDHWIEFWNYFNPKAMKEEILLAELLGMRTSLLPNKLSATIHGYPGIKNRNPFQTDLQVVAELVFEDVVRSQELETEFLQECYCKSGALSQYSMLSKNVLRARYSALESGTKLTAQPAVTKKGISDELLADSFKKRPTLLIGDTGVGKSMFIRNLIKVDAREILERGITLYVDMGSQATLTTDLNDFIPREIANQLNEDYSVDIYERNFVTGVYHNELQSFDRGIYGDLKHNNPAKYNDKRLLKLEELISRPHEHLSRSLKHIVKARKQQIVLFLDNVDQRDIETQQHCFLIAHEISERWPVTVFLALRPVTFHKSLREGTLTGYHPKAFTISPPRIVEVIIKRLNFALRLAKGELKITLLTADIELTALSKVIEAFSYSIQSNRELAYCIDNIAAGNVRIALEQVRDFFGSGHVDTRKIVDIVNEQGRYTVPVHEFLRATLYGDAIHYDPKQSTVPNIFDISEPDKREHFLVLLLLSYTQRVGKECSGDEAVDTKQVIEWLQDLGYTPKQIKTAVRKSLMRNLLDTASEKDDEDLELPLTLRVTSLGAYSLQYLCKKFTYIDAIIVDTPILEDNLRSTIEDVDTIAKRLSRAKVFIEYLDICWDQVSTDVRGVFDWGVVSADLRKEIEYIFRRTISQQEN